MQSAKHSTQKTQEILQDLSKGKFVLTEPVQENQGELCCERMCLPVFQARLAEQPTMGLSLGKTAVYGE
jgi:hypothetical protein